MDVAEYKLWLAFHRFVNPLGGEWRQSARIASAVLAPYTKRPPNEEDFMPLEKPPMTAAEIEAELGKIKKR